MKIETKRFCLNKNFYDEKIIAETIQAFSEFGEFTIEKNEKHYKLEFKPGEDSDSELMVKEFCNYALALTKNK